jgi:hypothetical protein
MSEDMGSQDSRAAQLATTPQDTYPWASLPEYNGLPKPIPKEAIGHIFWVFEQRKQYWNNGAVPRMVQAAMPDLALRSCMDRYGLERSQVMTQFHMWQKCGATVAAAKGVSPLTPRFFDSVVPELLLEQSFTTARSVEDVCSAEEVGALEAWEAGSAHALSHVRAMKAITIESQATGTARSVVDNRKASEKKASLTKNRLCREA